ncbi:MAG: lysylphosphatidylglycerol synthase transmembrane domain-containing protein [Bryobacteraceae bacterium]|nr:lysylphosphatidylglycerol synthase transmembrane domain-containing protein [Bryobacteraceae bacterium]
MEPRDRVVSEQSGVGDGRKQWIRRCLVLFFAVATAVAIYFAWRQGERDFRWSVFAATFTRMNWGWFSVSMGLVALTYVGRAVRWRLMMRPVRENPSFGGLLRSTVIGFTAVVLFGRAGELVRPYLISLRERVSFSSQVAAWLLERIYDLLSVLLLFGFALSRISSSSSKVGPGVEWVLQTGGHMVGILCTVCLAILVTFGLFPDFVEQRLFAVIEVLPGRLKERLQGMVKAFVAGTGSTRNFSFVSLLILYTFTEWLLITASFLSLFKAFPATEALGFIDSLIVVGFVAFGSAIQIPGVGGGMQVATVLILTELFRIPLETASGIAILIWLITFVMVVPFGLVLALRDGLQWRKLMDKKNLEAV